MGIQDFGPKFDLDKYFRARDVARNLTHELASLIRPDTTEEAAYELYKKLLSKYEIKKQWHPPKIRFGPNTLKSFREASDDYLLKEEDIFFIDIGPVIEDHEADYGKHSPSDQILIKNLFLKPAGQFSRKYHKNG